MAKPKKQKKSKVPVTKSPAPVRAADVAPHWEFFFRDQRSPILRSQLITALMTGHLLEVERLPTTALLDAVLLSMTTRNYLDAEIIDDYNALLRRTDEKWRDPMWTRRTFDQVHTNAASFILMGASEFVSAEDLYIPDLVDWFLQHEPPTYFTKELVV